MYRAAITTGLLLWLATAQAADVTLEWDAPTTNADGSELTDLAGYRIYRSTTSGDYPSDPLQEITDTSNVSFSLPNHPAGIFFYVVTAIDADGNESERSNEVSYNIAPGSPTNLRITITIQVTQ